MIIEAITGAGFIAVLAALAYLILEVKWLGGALNSVLRMVPAIQLMDRVINGQEKGEGLRYKGDAPPASVPSVEMNGQGVFFPHDVEGAGRGVFTEPGPSVEEAAEELLAGRR